MSEQKDQKSQTTKKTFDLKNILPATIFANKIAIPHNKIKFETSFMKKPEALFEAAKAFDDEVAFLTPKENEFNFNKPINKNDFKEIITVGFLDYKIKQEKGYKVRFTISKRVKLIDVFPQGEYLAIKYEPFNLLKGDEIQNKILHERILNSFTQITEYDLIQGSLLNEIKQEKDLEAFADMLIFNLREVKEEEKYEYLIMKTLTDRLAFLQKKLNEQKEYKKLEQKIQRAVDESLSQSQKEYFLREKIKAIQKELGDVATREQDVEKFRKRIEASNMPDKIKVRMEEEINRYLSTTSMSIDSSIIRNYLDFATTLPWNNETKDCDDIKNVIKVLDESHFGLKKVKERIIEHIAVKIKTKKNPQSIICLVGPPGVGKTSLAISIAKALNKKFVKISLGGTYDESEIRGHRRTYVGAMPGRILKSMQKAECVNPLFLIDEIDKMAKSNHGDPSSAMLEVLDPEQNSMFSDNYLEEPYDLSKVMFIATANYLENIPEALSDRMELVFLSSYTEIEKLNILKNYLIPKALKEHGLKKNEFIIPETSMYILIRNYTREAGVRELQRITFSLARKFVKIQLEKNESFVFDEKQIEKCLGPKLFTYNENKKINRIGVVTGLAYTQYGGDTLNVEVVKYSGKGQFIITGKLGDVMKESAQTAFSFLKSIAPKYKIDSKIFLENDFHIHVPEGAVPKDGPSAGITIATAFYSLLTDKAVNPNVGMTGEITLTGNILPIGGLKEKAIAANRSGLNKILIPFENQKDLHEIPDEVKKALKIIPVKTLDEVFKHAFNLNE